MNAGVCALEASAPSRMATMGESIPYSTKDNGATTSDSNPERGLSNEKCHDRAAGGTSVIRRL
jgi:hypothetical protein